MKQHFQKLHYRLGLFIGRCRRHLTVTRLVVLSFLLVLLIGSFLLYLPFSRAQGASKAHYIDCLFTAVSATCVTGLVTVTTATQWSLFGQIVILIMIQIGGLSFITLFTFIVINAGKKVNIHRRMLVQASLNQNSLQGMVRIVKLAIKGTFLLEGLGAITFFLYFWLNQGISPEKAIYWGIFHSISSFCNAGFDVISDSSLSAYVTSPLMNITVMVLIVTGGIGFTVWKDLIGIIKQRFVKQPGKRVRLSVHSKLALLSTLFLIVFGAAYFLATEYHNPATLGELSLGSKTWASLFQSVTTRTAGYYTINQNGLTESSKFVSSILMLIGGSPGGTAGGMKTVTLAVVVASIRATLKGRKDIDIFNRRLPWRALQKAITVIGLMLVLWFSVATLLEFTETGSLFQYTFMDLLFETASGLGTVGLTTGITPFLSPIGKILIMLCMFIGRLGPISIAVALQRKMHASEESIHYPEEDVLIG